MQSVFSAFFCLLINFGMFWVIWDFIQSGDWKIFFLRVKLQPVVDKSYRGSQPRKFALFMVKFYATTVMHLHICPRFENSMNMMKYVSNHPGKFDMPWLAFMIGFTQFCYCPIMVAINSVGFMHRENVHFAVLAHFSAAILVDLPRIYFNTFMRD